MNKVDEKFENLSEMDFFEKRGGLLKAMKQFERHTENKIPWGFNVNTLPMFTDEDGEVAIELGSLHRYFFAGFITKGDDGERQEYRMFESKMELSLYFTKINNVDKDKMAFWLHKIKKIPTADKGV